MTPVQLFTTTNESPYPPVMVLESQCLSVPVYATIRESLPPELPAREFGDA